MTTMRAKMQVSMVQENLYPAAPDKQPEKHSETLTMHAVCKQAGYDESGLDEDNTFAKFTPGATLSINIANPGLWGKFKHGDKFYVDFSSAD